MKPGRRHVILLSTDQTENNLPKQAKLLLTIKSIFWWPKYSYITSIPNSWDFTLGKAAVSQRKLPRWVNGHEWSTHMRKGQVPETHHQKQQRVYNSGREHVLEFSTWFYIKSCGSTSWVKGPTQEVLQSRVGQEPGMCLSCSYGLEAPNQGCRARGSCAKSPGLG